MKEQITVYYFKDKLHPDDYIVKRVLTQQDDYYSVISYYNINGKIKDFPSRLKLSGAVLNNYLLLCKKAPFFDKIEYQNVMEGI